MNTTSEPSAWASGAPSASDASPSTNSLVLTAVLVVLGTLGFGALVAVGLLASTGHYVAEHSPVPGGLTGMPAASPEGVLELASVSSEIALEYRFAADHADHYDRMRCWCGCETAFDHASLRECFVRDDGAWEAHGAGCSVCITEATTARTRIDEGVPIRDIAAELDESYGPTSLPTSSTLEKGHTP